MVNSVMDIKTEREAFLDYMRSIGAARFMFELDEDGNFDDMSMSYAWSAWQAKAQAVPEGFVIFPKKQTSKMRSLARDFDARLSLTKYEQLHNIWVKQAMLEAQEQK